MIASNILNCQKEKEFLRSLKKTLPQDDWGYETLRRWEDAPQGDGGDAIPKCIFCTQVLKESPTLIHIRY